MFRLLMLIPKQYRLAAVAVVAVFVAVATVKLAVWLLAGALVLGVLAVLLAVVSRHLTDLAVVAWNSPQPRPRVMLTPKAPAPAVEAAPAQLALEAAPVRLDDVAAAAEPEVPTPHQLGLTANPDLSWDDIGIAKPTFADLFGPY